MTSVIWMKEKLVRNEYYKYTGIDNNKRLRLLCSEMHSHGHMFQKVTVVRKTISEWNFLLTFGIRRKRGRFGSLEVACCFSSVKVFWTFNMEIASGLQRCVCGKGWSCWTKSLKNQLMERAYNSMRLAPDYQFLW